MTEQKSGFYYGKYILRGALIFALLFAIKSLMYIYCLLTFETSKSGASAWIDIPIWAIYAVVSLGIILVYNSLSSYFTLYDREQMKEFLARKIPKIQFRNEMKAIFASRTFWVQTLTVYGLSILSALLGAFDEFSGAFASTAIPSAILSAFPFIALTLIIPLIGALAHYESIRRWHYLDHTGRLEILYSPIRIISKGFIIFFGYILIFPLSPIVIVAYLSVFGIFGTFFDFYFIVIALTVIAAFIGLIIFIKMIRALLSRKKLIKKIREYAKAGGYELSEIIRPYASLFKPIREASFTLKIDGKTFTCRLIGSWWHRAPLYFISNKHAYYRHRLGTNGHHVEILGEFDYSFDGDGKKLIILNPVPKNAFATNKDAQYIEHSWYDEDRRSSVMRGSDLQRPEKFKRKSTNDVRRLEPGDKIFEYTIYNTTSFLGAIDRKCLGRTNGMFE